jgi:hypothetical protein
METWLVSLAIGVRTQRCAVRADSAEQAFARANDYFKRTAGVFGEPLFARVIPEGSVFAQSAI